MPQLGTDRLGQVGQDPHAVALANRVEGGVLDAVGLGQADDVDLLDTGGAQDVVEAAPVVIDTLEPGVGGGVLALLDGGVRDETVQGGVDLGLSGAGHPVNGPGVDEVRL